MLYINLFIVYIKLYLEMYVHSTWRLNEKKNCVSYSKLQLTRYENFNSAESSYHDRKLFNERLCIVNSANNERDSQLLFIRKKLLNNQPSNLICIGVKDCVVMNMVPYICDCKLIFFLYSIQTTLSMSVLSNNPLFLINRNTEQEVTDFITGKGYIPVEKKISKPPIIKSTDNDVTYLLSKLSDEDLIKLLNEQPNKNEYNLKELVKITSNPISTSNYGQTLDLGATSKSTATLPNANLIENFKKTRFQTVSDTRPQSAFFRLENKEVDPFATPKSSGIEYSAVQRLNNLLYSRPSEAEPQNKAVDDDEKKELLFDVLVAQLKSLCCKRNKPLKNNETSKSKLKDLLNNILPQGTNGKIQTPRNTVTTMPNEHMFLVLNDEIKSNGNEGDLISVDPDSLGKNSSVMLLGPIATPLSDIQLKVVMMRISNELSKPEYVPLLQQISEGTLSNEHVGFVESIISGPQTRRYIKPHRCNHQSQMTRIYGGPKWIICTGYLNLNKPSLYD